MAREVEVKILNINRDKVVDRLKSLKAQFLGNKILKRVTFQLTRKGKIKKPLSSSENEEYHAVWLRVRTDGSKTTLTLKEQYGTGISKRTEHEVIVDDFIKTVKIIRSLLPNAEYNYIETSREKYVLDDAEITIDKWPQLPYQLEIEGKSEEKVNTVYEKLNIKNKTSPNLAVSDKEYYKLNGLDYGKIQKKYRNKLDEMLGL